MGFISTVEVETLLRKSFLERGEASSLDIIRTAVSRSDLPGYYADSTPRKNEQFFGSIEHVLLSFELLSHARIPTGCFYPKQWRSYLIPPFDDDDWYENISFWTEIGDLFEEVPEENRDPNLIKTLLNSPPEVLPPWHHQKPEAIAENKGWSLSLKYITWMNYGRFEGLLLKHNEPSAQSFNSAVEMLDSWEGFPDELLIPNTFYLETEMLGGFDL